MLINYTAVLASVNLDVGQLHCMQWGSSKHHLYGAIQIIVALLKSLLCKKSSHVHEFTQM